MAFLQAGRGGRDRFRRDHPPIIQGTFTNEEDAFAAVRALQGFVVAGSALRIEFAKTKGTVTSQICKGRCSYSEEYFSSLLSTQFTRNFLKGRLFESTYHVPSSP
ncbi:hypothetical protein U1Q18_031010 [Sarracenia purpurea var. burkii]